MHYVKPPILEAMLELRWAERIPLDRLDNAIKADVFSSFEAPKPRKLVNATLDIQANEFSHKSEQLGFEVASRDGSERVFLERDKFVFLQRAPYSHWDEFSKRALGLLNPTAKVLGVKEYVRAGVRFVNRIDAPMVNNSINTDDYINIKFDGPREDKGSIDEFQMRVVKPTLKDNISYALVVATTNSPLPDHTGIILDIDVFTRDPIPASGKTFRDKLADMSNEKNAIFELCITKASQKLFGGQEQ